jgi:hypothetical protein
MQVISNTAQKMKCPTASESTIIRSTSLSPPYQLSSEGTILPISKFSFVQPLLQEPAMETIWDIYLTGLYLRIYIQKLTLKVRGCLKKLLALGRPSQKQGKREFT